MKAGMKQWENCFVSALTVYWQMTVEFGRRNMQMYIDWLESCIERLEEME